MHPPSPHNNRVRILNRRWMSSNSPVSKLEIALVEEFFFKLREGSFKKKHPYLALRATGGGSGKIPTSLTDFSW